MSYGNSIAMYSRIMQATQVHFRLQVKQMQYFEIGFYHQPEVVDLVLHELISVHNLTVQFITEMLFLVHKISSQIFCSFRSFTFLFTFKGIMLMLLYTKIWTVTFRYINSNITHMSDKIGVRIESPVNQQFWLYAYFSCYPWNVNCGLLGFVAMQSCRLLSTF